MSSQNFQYACALSGIPLVAFALCSFIACGFLPPIPPSWNAEQTVNHYKAHEKGIYAGVSLLMIASLFYLPLTAVISAQMRRIPNLHPVVSDLQLAAGAGGLFIVIMPAVVLAATNFRLDRPVEITQALNDLFWVVLVMTYPPMMVQFACIAYATIIDCRPNLLFPKPIAILSILLSVTAVPATVALHCTKTGPIAWNGAVSFWLPLIIWVLQIVMETLCLARAVSTDKLESIGDTDG